MANPHQNMFPTDEFIQALVFRLKTHLHLNGEQRREWEPIPENKFGLQNKLNLFELTGNEYLLLLIALAPHVQPHLFDQVIREAIPEAGDFPQIGGVRGKNFRGFLPTGETALFLLAGDDVERRKEVQQLFDADHFFAKKRLVWLEEVPEGEPRMSGRIIISNDCVDLVTTGKVSKPWFSMNFPAKLLETEMEDDDLVLNKETRDQIDELKTWVKYHHVIMDNWGMKNKLKPGYRVLFYGPPGTGKTLTASLLGKATGKDVYKIDLSMVVSKYIGETEKNLSKLFARAESKDWILFFDEADAIFGKRTDVQDAHDKYANQEVSYLLQRVESYDGLVILATNFRSNVDEAFIRRFQAIIHFPMPKVGERLLLWKKSFGVDDDKENYIKNENKVRLAPELQLSTIAQKYELSGAEIMNVVQYCLLRKLERNPKLTTAGSNGQHFKGDGDPIAIITEEDIIYGIRREFQKEGKIMR